MLAQAPVDHRGDQLVGDQLAGGHAAPDLGAQFGVVLDVPAEDVADADVLEIEAFGQQLGLGALAAALDAHDDVLVHPHLPRAGAAYPSSSIEGVADRPEDSTAPLLI
jgi:hypothetical protein